jgi:hypothetical protein
MNTTTGEDAKLRQQVESCHKLLDLGWDFVYEYSAQTDMSTNHIGKYLAQFTVTIDMDDSDSRVKYHAGCVQEAIANAGGPTLASGNCIKFPGN